MHILWHFMAHPGSFAGMEFNPERSRCGCFGAETSYILQYFSANILYFTDVYLDCICVLVCSSWLHDYFDWTLPFLFKCWSEFKAFLLNTRQDRSCMCLWCIYSFDCGARNELSSEKDYFPDLEQNFPGSQMQNGCNLNCREAKKVLSGL